MTETTEALTSQASPESDFPFIGKVARRELALHGYVRLDQLPAVSERELLAIHGVGPKAVRILREALAERGLAFNEQSSGRRST